MAKIGYIAIRFNTATKALIQKANAIIEDYDAQGLSLTLRQLYYRFVALNLIPNTLRSYKNLGDTISRARLSGLVDWDAITDRTRSLKGINFFDSAAQCMREAARDFHLDRHATQPRHIEVWIEKDALVDVVAKACNPLHVDFFSCRGYTSQSSLHGAAMRLKEFSNSGQDPLIIHLGDHDPSGRNMTHDIEGRMEMFGVQVEVDRIALNIDQVRKYNPPPNPAKEKDSRYKNYVREFGKKCWELDALEPQVIVNLITKTIKAAMDEDAYKAIVAEEEKQRQTIHDFADGAEDREPVTPKTPTLPELQKNLVSIKRQIRERKKKEAKQKREDKRRKERERKAWVKAKAKREAKK